MRPKDWNEFPVMKRGQVDSILQCLVNCYRFEFVFTACEGLHSKLSLGLFEASNSVQNIFLSGLIV